MPHLAEVISATLQGIDAEMVRVEADVAAGLPGISLVGLPGSAVRESKDRVRAAISNSGFSFPMRRITINLSPADAKKDGSHFDLPIAVALLVAIGVGKINLAMVEQSVFLGELSLTGAVDRIDAVAALVIGMYEKGIRRIFLPLANMVDVPSLKGLSYYPIRSLRECMALLMPGEGDTGFEPVVCLEDEVEEPEEGVQPEPGDFSEVFGQERTKRALIVAAAGAHDILLVGPPGIGKSMMAGLFSHILPPLNRDERMEVTRIHSIAGLAAGRGLLYRRPFRSPHHSSTVTAIVGGGSTRIMPGEVSLAHRGVLFLDELPEFSRRTLDMLRQPMESRYVDISRAGFKERVPCDFRLIAAMNPCPCGYRGDPVHPCTCPVNSVERYAARVSGPLMDRIDMRVVMGSISPDEIRKAADGDKRGLSSAEMRRAVLAATAFRKRRGSESEAGLQFSEDAEAMIMQAYTKYGLSMRGRGKIRAVSRTVADLAASEVVLPEHIAEALSYKKEEGAGLVAK